MSMQATFKVEVGTVMAKAGEMEGISGNLQTIVTKIETAINSLQGKWTGSASSKFSSQFAQLKDDTDQMVNIVKEYVSDLREIGTTYEQAESDIESAIIGLPTDVF